VPLSRRRLRELEALPRATKAHYVLSQGQTRDHTCHWPGCNRQVPPAAWGCREHWVRLPPALRKRMWAAYRPGQEKMMTPSRAYLAVAHEVEQWVLTHAV
jgi:hypothetical protein